MAEEALVVVVGKEKVMEAEAEELAVGAMAMAARVAAVVEEAMVAEKATPCTLAGGSARCCTRCSHGRSRRTAICQCSFHLGSRRRRRTDWHHL